MKLQGSLEDNILTLLCWSDEHAPAISLQVTPELFSTRAYRKIATKALEYNGAYSKTPGVHLRDLLEGDLQRGEDGKLLGRVLEDMDGLKEAIQPDYVMSELARFVATRKLKLAVADAADAIDRGDLEAAERALSERENLQSSSAGIWLHDSENMLRFLNELESDYFSSGIATLDERGVRPGRKTLFLVVGAKGIGKSFWCIDAGKAAIMHRKNVLHISLENSEEETAKRYTQALFAMTVGKAETIRVPIFRRDQLGRFTGIEFDTRVAEGINTETRGSVAKKLSAFKTRSRLLIKEFPTGALTVPQLNSYLDQLSRTENFRPDVLIVDSGNKLTVRGEHMRTDMSRNFTLLRGLCSARNIAGFVTTHSNRSGDIAKLVSGAAHVGEDYSMLGTADVVCTISKTASEKENGIARILVDKCRTGPDKWISTISQSYQTAQFCLDSVYFGKHVAEEMERISGEDGDNDDKN
jgi:KaiC/GvpD/RAD55 family RecA-like ATPase